MGFQPDMQDVAAEIRLLNDGTYQQARQWVTEFIRRARRASGPADLFDLHRDLLIRARAHQELRCEFEAERMADRERIASLASQVPKPVSKIRAVQEMLDAHAHQENVQWALHHVMRSLGDALVWKALGYDRAGISVLGQGERVGWLSDGIGFDAEVGHLAALWERNGTFAILNDLTNCLRIGDLTAVMFRDGGRDVGIQEVKASGRLGAHSPQAMRITEAVALLQSGASPSAADGRPLRLDRVPGRYRTYLDSLTALVRKARRDGFAAGHPHPCLAVAVVDYPQWAGKEQQLQRRDEAAREQLGWFARADYVFQWHSGLRRMRDRRASFAYLAPATILPLPAEDVADLALGFLDFSTLLNMTLLGKAFQSSGLRAVPAEPHEAGELFMHVMSERVRVSLPAQLREQMLNELMTPASLIRAVSHAMQVVEHDPQAERAQSFVTFQDEERVWTGFPPD